MPSLPPCSLALITPPLSAANAGAFAGTFAEVLAAAPAASALVRLAPGAEAEAKAIVAPLLKAAGAADCALLVENDARLAARLGADGVHVAGAGEALEEALESLKPERIVGAGALRMRDEAMTAGEMGADYVMFGEPRGAVPAMALELLVERVAWWAEIFLTPCVAYAESIDAAGRLARAGADFVALDDAIWNASSPPEAARRALGLLIEIAAETP
jgi:thiamine-phosphate pyrophosphorylase